MLHPVNYHDWPSSPGAASFSSQTETFVKYAQALVTFLAPAVLCLFAPAANAQHDHSGHSTVSTMDHARSETIQPHLENGVLVVPIMFSSQGFTPSQVKLKQGQSVRLVFTRTDDKVCGPDIDIPALGKKALKLPLNKPVPVEFTPDKAGTITFACGMDMLKGTLVVSR